MDGSALEVALALMRMPSMRMALRCRPLPDGVGEVIELAAGAPGRVAEAAARSGESPADVLEAARFYVREVLLFAGADAYRVLGVAPGAPDVRVRQHHRHLQQWLHPDRDQEGWESVFAARINAAWADLRSPSRRAAYDARRALDADAGPEESRRVLVSDWRPTQEVDDQHWRHWVLPVAAVACCLCLVVLAVRQADAPGPRWQVAPGQEEGALDLPESVVGAVAAVAGARSDGALPGSAGGSPSTPDSALGRKGDQLGIVIDVAGNPSPRNQPAPAQRAGSVGPRGSAAQADRPHRLEAEGHASVAIDPAGEFVASGAVAEETDDDVGMASVEANAGASSAPAPAPAPAHISVPASVPVSAPAVTISPQRVQLLQRVSGDLTEYLAGDARRPPPIWNTATAQDAAASLRQQLDGARFGDADWHVGAECARMTSAVRRRGRRDAPSVLRAEFAWREGLWLVDALSVEQAR